MAEQLKHFFNPKTVKTISNMLVEAHPDFPHALFIQKATHGLDSLELMERGRHIMLALRATLPEDVEKSLIIIEKSLGPELSEVEGQGMAPFLYLPHVLFVSEYGVENFSASMRTQHALTRRFTCEFSIRAFLTRHPHETLRILKKWANDPSVHVRRLVSEGTRPRLPWAPRLRDFQNDPTPVLSLLELLKDDPELYVRRSVANNLNDIGKDHPALLVEVCEKWSRDASEERRWIIRHALRSLVKKGNARALALLGFKGGGDVDVKGRIRPTKVRLGEEATVTITVRNHGKKRVNVVVDVAVHFVKANGKSRPKVFKGRSMTLGAGESQEFLHKMDFRDFSTRRHHAGKHEVEALVNGRAVKLGAVLVTDG